MAMQVFYDYAVTFDTTVDVLVDGISSVNISEGASVSAPMLDGSDAPTLTYITGYEQSIDFSSTQIATLMALLTTSEDCTVGKAIGASDAMLFFKRPAASGGTRQTGSVNEKYTVNSGIIIPTSLTASNDSPAALMAMVHPVYDGTNSPIVYQGSQALAGTAAPSEIYYAGPAVLNGTAIDGVQSVSINFGVQVSKLKDGGEADNSLCWVRFRNPIISVTTTNIDLHRTYARGVTISGETKAFLRAASANGTRTAEATAAHPAFTATSGIIKSAGINSGQPQTVTLEIHCNNDGTNPVLGYALEAIA